MAGVIIRKWMTKIGYEDELEVIKNKVRALGNMLKIATLKI